MTLQEFFNLLGDHPVWILAYFILIPFTALLAGIMGKGEGHLDPWKYLYSALIYLVCVPGIFAITLSVWVFIFERRSILQTNLFTQVLPVASMLLTLFLVRRNVDLKYIPGFDKLAGLITLLFATIAIFWILDKTRIWVVTVMPFWLGILIFAGLLALIRFGWARMSDNNNN